MADARSENPFSARLLSGPSKAQWCVLLGLDALTIIGLATGILGAGWMILTPWLAAVVYVAWVDLSVRRELRRGGPRAS